MAITDELRKQAHGFHTFNEVMLLAIADRIDAEHEAMLIDARKTAYEGYIELPKDADGEPIHIGDVMKGEKIGGGFCGPFEVVGYIMRNGELEPMDEHRNARKHKYLHHHKQPTVEDVLREMADRCYADEDEPRNRDAIVSEYAAKLRLAEGEES